MKTSTKKYITLLLLALVFGVWYGIFYQKKENNHAFDKSNLKATVLSEPRNLLPFTLTDDKNLPFTEKNLLGKWTFLFFGFTQCHSICPTTLAEMKKVFDTLPSGAYPAQMVLVTVDPANDTPQKLNTYLKNFNPSFIGVTGNETELANLRKQLGILAMKNIPQPHQNSVNQDMFDHSGTIILVDPQGKFYALFSMPHTASTMVKDFTIIEKNYK